MTSERPTPSMSTVNGETVALDPAGRSLLDVLRSDLGLVGARTGCAIGECGACTVLLDGSPVRACTTLASEVTGRTVVTPEGLGTPDAPHPVQRAFLERQAAQCGYCVNGIIATVASLAATGATEDELAAALDEHLCRCGAHLRLLAAAREALGFDARPAAPADAAVGSGPAATAADDPPRGDGPPAAVRTHPRVEQWIGADADGRLVVHAGKVELGQGIRTAFRQIVAAQVGVPVAQVTVAPTTTGRSPDLGYTAGSLSVEDGGTALAWAAVGFRRVLLERAATALGVPVGRLEVTAAGVGTVDGTAHRTLAALLSDGPVTGLVEPGDVPRWDLPPIGQPVARADLVEKLTGAAGYLQDVALPGTVHARVVLPPSERHELVDADLAPARGMDGVVDVVRDGRLLVVLAEREHEAVRAAERLRGDVRWSRPAGDVTTDLESHLRSLPSEPFPRHRGGDVAVGLSASARQHRATYVTPYQAHGAVAPSVAVAELADGHLTVRTHSQGIYPLRRELATLLDVEEEAITVEHVDGAGCYGMNGADDAAGFAAVASRAVPGRPVRLQLSTADEFGWAPYGPAAVVDVEAAVDDAGRLTAWRHRVVTDSHTARPDGSGDRLAVSWLRSGGPPRPWPGPSEGGARNAVPLYDVPAVDAVADHVRGPLRTSSLRTLGAFANLFAIESSVDEVAELAGRDPVEFRLAHLSDDRARTVLEVAAERAGWQRHAGPSGRGLGVAVARYKDSKAYVAVVAEVDVDTATGRLRVLRVVVAADAGAVIDPGGIRNQLEGGTLQGLSRTLCEEIHPGADGARERDWTTYPVLRFRDVPEVDVHVVARPGQPPLGVGEAATPTVPAAVANAVDDAVGVRLRRLPLTPARIERRLLEMDETEAARVRL